MSLFSDDKDFKDPENGQAYARFPSMQLHSCGSVANAAPALTPLQETQSAPKQAIDQSQEEASSQDGTIYHVQQATRASRLATPRAHRKAKLEAVDPIYHRTEEALEISGPALANKKKPVIRKRAMNRTL